ncbi:MAG: alpha/beta fold hydrolase [Actinomycetota bacterium]
MAHFDGRGFRIHYVEEGDGPSIVFAHEMTMDHTMFAAQFEDLPEHYRCLAWDMRGHGRSDLPSHRWTVQDLVVDLVGFIEGTHAAPAHLVGISTGGLAAMRVAIQREDVVRSLVLINTTPAEEDPEWATMYRGFQEQIASDDGMTEEFARQTVGIFYSPSFVESNPEVLDIHVDRMKKMTADAIISSLGAANGRDSVIERLGEIKVPTLVIHGEQDGAIPLSRAEELASGIPGAEFVRIPDAGHTPPLEAPDVVNEALAGFFARVKR